jgi:NDP-sugar pyrophosphorylase family protein
MKVVILAAGRGKRMGEYTETTTKAMLPILTEDQQMKPMLQITIERFVKVGLKEFILVVGYRKEDIIGFFGDGKNFGAKIQYITQKNPCAGTADAVRCVNYFFEGHQDVDHETPFYLVFGDVVSILVIKTPSSLANRFLTRYQLRKISNPYF